MSKETKDKHVVERAAQLLEEHELEIIKELGASAFDELSPREVANILGYKETKHLTDLVRQTWLAPVPERKIGSANLYFRWRVEFVKRYKKRYSETKK
jgi:hypothetical protein